MLPLIRATPEGIRSNPDSFPLSNIFLGGISQPLNTDCCLTSCQGLNSAILRYAGAPIKDPASPLIVLPPSNLLNEADLSVGAKYLVPTSD